MAKYNKQIALQIIMKAAKEYDEKLKDKHFLIVYRKEHVIETVKVGFRDFNFLHLTGVSTKLSAQMFYASCIEARLSENDFELDKKGKVQQKLMVLPYLSNLLYHNCMIGNFINSGVFLKADYFVGNTKVVLSIGFKSGSNIDYPVTLYNEDVRRLTNPTNKVLAIFMKEYNQSDYIMCTYQAKNCDISKVPISEDLKRELIFKKKDILQ